jgi:neutral ceramidase
VDRSVTVIIIGPEDGPPLILVNFACHPVILGPNNYAISADWVGVMRRTVEAETGGLCLFIQGATADVNPYMEWSKDNWPDVERMGTEVGQEVLRILSLTMQPLDLAPIRGETATFWADLDLPDTKRDGSVPTYHEELNRHLPEIPTGFVDALLNMRYPWKTVVRWVNSTPQTPIELGALRLGDVAIAALAMEPFTETGLAVKETSPAPVTLFAGYANGLTGYLPTASEHALGGYEVEVAPYFYRLPGVFAAESEAEVVKRLGEMVKALYS